VGEHPRQDRVPTNTRGPLIPVPPREEEIILQQDNNINDVNSHEETEAPVVDLLHQEPGVPLFLKDSSEGRKGNPQDEKDKTGE